VVQHGFSIWGIVKLHSLGWIAIVNIWEVVEGRFVTIKEIRSKFVLALE
jgi:hypothetical protein